MTFLMRGNELIITRLNKQRETETAVNLLNLIIDKHDPDPEENKTTQRLILPAFRVIYLAAKTGLASTAERAIARPTATADRQSRARSGIRTETTTPPTTTTERGLPPPSLDPSAARVPPPSPHACLPFLGRNRSLGRSDCGAKVAARCHLHRRQPHWRKADHIESKKSIAGEGREAKRSRDPETD